MDEASEDASFILAQALREEGLKVDLFLGEAKPKKIFSYTDKKEPTFLIMLGSNEIQNKEIQIKNLKDKSSITFKLDEIKKMSEFMKGIA